MTVYYLKDEYLDQLYIKRTITSEEYEELKAMISDEVDMYEPVEITSGDVE